MKSSKSEGERILAVFIDFENLGLGFGNRRDRFEIGKVLERMVEKGKIVAKKAYADWSRFGEYTRSLHEAAIELVEIPRRNQTGKNSADIRLVVDAIDLAYSKDHIDTFVIVSGDSDFSPLVSKLKELGKHVIGLGLADATSALLRDNCDEFIYYEDLDRAPLTPIETNENVPEQKRKVFALLLDSLLALRRENKEVILSSMVKDTMKRKKPSFNEGYYGYRTFSELLEDAQKEGMLTLEKHKSSGMYVVTRFGLEMQSGRGSGATTQTQTRRADGREGDRRGEGREGGRSRSRRGGRSRSERPAEPAPAPGAAPVDDDAYEPAPERPPLGKALFAEVDDADLELPTYRPRRPAQPAEPRRTPPPPRVEEPAAAEVPPPPRRPAEPRRAPPRVEELPPTAADDPPPPRRPAQRRPAPPKAPEPQAPPPPRRSPDADDGGFGAGLDM